MQLKKLLRTQILDSRKNFDENAYFSENNSIIKSIQELILSLIPAKKIGILDKRAIVGIYWPLKGEPDLLKFVVNPIWIIGLPKIKGIKMSFVKYDTGEALEKSHFSQLMYPSSNNKLSPNIVIIPGIAYSVQGERLGFGLGHYDRYFAKNNLRENVIKIGVCFHENLYENLPQELHDIKLNYIITDKIIISI